MPSRRQLLNIALIGPPGSGKGSYGRLLAEFLSVRLLTASDILRASSLDTSSGKLLDDDLVSNVLVKNIVPSGSTILMDGFPRTVAQLNLMKSSWPVSSQLHTAVSLEVPRQVCKEKMLGRRFCKICQKSWNLAHVNYGDFYMPASLPNGGTCKEGDCSKETDWIQRADDTPEIIEDRLDAFYELTEPILERYAANGMLFRFTPYRGFDEVPRFQSELSEWLHQQRAEQ